MATNNEYQKIQLLIDEHGKNKDLIKQLQERNGNIHDEIAFSIHGVKPGVVIEEFSSWGGEPKPTGKFYMVTGIMHNVSYHDKVTDIPDVMAKALKKDGKPASRPATRVFTWRVVNDPQ